MECSDDDPNHPRGQGPEITYLDMKSFARGLSNFDPRCEFSGLIVNHTNTIVEMGHSTISHCLAQDLLEIGVPGILQGTSRGKAAGDGANVVQFWAIPSIKKMGIPWDPMLSPGAASYFSVF